MSVPLSDLYCYLHGAFASFPEDNGPVTLVQLRKCEPYAAFYQVTYETNTGSRHVSLYIHNTIRTEHSFFQWCLACGIEFHVERIEL